MFDQSIPEAAGWQETLSRGDIVLFRFPIIENGFEAAKTRPCLVLDVEVHGGNRRAALAYGTSAQTAANRGYEIWVKRQSSMAVAGLYRPMRFVGSRRISVALCHAGFKLGEQGSPVIGQLDDYLVRRMNAVRARMQAEQDIAMEALQEKREERQRWLRENATLASPDLSARPRNGLLEGIV